LIWERGKNESIHESYLDSRRVGVLDVFEHEGSEIKRKGGKPSKKVGILGSKEITGFSVKPFVCYVNAPGCLKFFDWSITAKGCWISALGSSFDRIGKKFRRH
jgi:hypothetical protein